MFLQMKTGPKIVFFFFLQVPTFLSASLPVPEEPEQPVTDVLMEIFPEMEKTPTGIAATRRRPIKGAAGRPVKFQYPDTPMSPNTADQQEVQHRQVPLWVQLLIFLILTLLLYVTYLAIEDTAENPVTLLLGSLNQVAEAVEEQLAAPSGEEAPMMPDADVPPVSGM